MVNEGFEQITPDFPQILSKIFKATNYHIGKKNPESLNVFVYLHTQLFFEGDKNSLTMAATIEPSYL